MLKAKLVVVGGDAKTTEVNLRLPTVIGRGKEGVTLTLPHQLVSRKHTEIFEKDGYLFVRDMGSLNGTYVNNRRITEPQIFKPGELLTLGNVTFRAVYDVEDGNGVKSITPASGAELPETEAAEVQFNEVKEPVAAQPLADEATGAVPTIPTISSQSDQDTASANPQPTPEVAVAANSAEVVPPAADDRVAVAPKSIRSDSTPVVTAADDALASEEVLDEGLEVSDAGSETNRSLFVDDAESKIVAGTEATEPEVSSVFALDEDALGGPEKSISLSGLNGLPDGQPQVSFVGKLDFEGAEPVTSDVEAIELDLGSEGKPADAAESGLSGLGSFLKKLPK